MKVTLAQAGIVAGILTLSWVVGGPKDIYSAPPTKEIGMYPHTVFNSTVKAHAEKVATLVPDSIVSDNEKSGTQSHWYVLSTTSYDEARPYFIPWLKENNYFRTNQFLSEVKYEAEAVRSSGWECSKCGADFDDEEEAEECCPCQHKNWEWTDVGSDLSYAEVECLDCDAQGMHSLNIIEGWDAESYSAEQSVWPLSEEDMAKYKSLVGNTRPASWPSALAYVQDTLEEVLTVRTRPHIVVMAKKSIDIIENMTKAESFAAEGEHSWWSANDYLDGKWYICSNCGAEKAGGRKRKPNKAGCEGRKKSAESFSAEEFDRSNISVPKDWEPKKYPYEKRVTSETKTKWCENCGELDDSDEDAWNHYQFVLKQKNSTKPVMRFISGGACEGCGSDLCQNCMDGATSGNFNPLFEPICDDCGYPFCKECKDEDRCDNCEEEHESNRCDCCGHVHHAESKLPPAEKAGITGVASGATMEGLETLLSEPYDGEDCPLCLDKIDFTEAYEYAPLTLCDTCSEAVMEKRFDHAYSAEDDDSTNCGVCEVKIGYDEAIYWENMKYCEECYEVQMIRDIQNYTQDETDCISCGFAISPNDVLVELVDGLCPDCKADGSFHAEDLAEVRTDLSQKRTNMSALRTALSVAGLFLVWDSWRWSKEERKLKGL